MDKIKPPKSFTIAMQCDVVDDHLIAITHVTTEHSTTRHPGVYGVYQENLAQYDLGPIAFQALAAHLAAAPDIMMPTEAPACPT